MELQFPKKKCRCLKTVVREVQNQEQTQELRLSDGMPDIGRVVGAWGQVIVRGKEWRGESICLSGGCMVWVLYVPEDGSEPRMLDSWIPFQMKWSLPESMPEGEIRMDCRLRFADARSVSPRKILARVGLAALAEAFSPMEAEIPTPEELPEDVQLLRRTYPVRIPKEAGEKLVTLEDALNMPGSAPGMKQLLSYSMNPKVTDQKIMTGRLVFRGNGNLHMLYLGEDGQVYSWDFEIPFSQLADLEGEFGGDAQPDLKFCVTELELDRDEDGKLKMKCSLAAQYRISNREDLELIEDAYSNRRPVTLQRGNLEIPVILDNGSVNIYGEQTVQGAANVVADAQYFPDYPRLMHNEQGVGAELNGQYQMLFYDDNGQLQSSTARWEDRVEIPADPEAKIYADLNGMGEVTSTPGSDGVKLQSEMLLEQQTVAGNGMTMVTGLEMEEMREPDPGRPSLILRRQGENGLWELAKMSGSTMDAIRQANGLTDEPAVGKLLLIPVL